MKVVLFCGGFGTRIRGDINGAPKPLITIRGRPILWHIMKYYAYYGHKDFILCLGYKADVIKKYFLECARPDASSRTSSLESTGSGNFCMESDDWRIRFVDTGLDTIIGQRLKAIEPFIERDETFLVNYSDGLTDLHLPDLLNHFYERELIGSFLSILPRNNSFHEVSADRQGRVIGIRPIHQSDIWMNGGYFVFNRKIFDYIYDDEELIEEPFSRLIVEGKLSTLQYGGFWASMDTFKDREILEDMAVGGSAPWEIWRKPQRQGRVSPERADSAPVISAVDLRILK